jgi:hypothetical protein
MPSAGPTLAVAARPARSGALVVRAQSAKAAAGTVRIIIQGRKLPVTDAIKLVSCFAPPRTFAAKQATAPVLRGAAAVQPQRPGLPLPPLHLPVRHIDCTLLPMLHAFLQYVEEKVAKSVANFAHTLKEVDVTLSARGGDTGTHGKK